ncbi:MAG: DinB family protein [Fimbriimonas sp.]
MDNLKLALKGQYHAALDMLKGAIEACPEEIWVGGVPPRSFWRLAYHTLFYTHLYLEVRMDDFVAWELHRDEVESDQERERMDAAPYTKAEILRYWELVDAMVDPKLDRIDLDSLESGFSWYSIPKLDHQILNIRHIQEHAGQLRDRLMEAGIDQGWTTKR